MHTGDAEVVDSSYLSRSPFERSGTVLFDLLSERISLSAHPDFWGVSAQLVFHSVLNWNLSCVAASLDGEQLEEGRSRTLRTPPCSTQ